MSEPAGGPLEGVRVLDLTSMISGPVATMMLGDQGADVIKVEPPGGDLVRNLGPNRAGFTASFVSSNRSKRSLVLDLKSAAGLAALKRLIPTADVFVQNFRPGAIERMGLGENVVRALRNDIVYVSISGFGETGPYAHKRVYDPVIQALSGLAAIQADRDTGRPRMVRTIIPDKTTALTAAQAITAALVRARTHRQGSARQTRDARRDGCVPVARGNDEPHLRRSRSERIARADRAGSDLSDDRWLHHRGRRIRCRVARHVHRARTSRVARRRTLQDGGRPRHPRARAARDDRGRVAAAQQCRVARTTRSRRRSVRAGACRARK